jgi:enoyl-CoA hydratase/carnithine racemase
MEGFKADLKEPVVLKREGDVFWLILNNKMNNFNPEFIRQIDAKLDEVLQSEGAACLVTTSSHPKVFSSGLDLKYLASCKHKDEVQSLLLEAQRLFGRILTFPVPTIALINGHAVAGGFMLAMAHDFRIMRSDLGMCSMNEIDHGLPLPPGMNALVQGKLAPRVHRDLALTGKKFSPQEALELKMVDKIVSGKELLSEARKLAEELAPKGEVREAYGQMKTEIYEREFNTLTNVGLRGSIIGAEKLMSIGKPKL